MHVCLCACVNASVSMHNVVQLRVFVHLYVGVHVGGGVRGGCRMNTLPQNKEHVTQRPRSSLWLFHREGQFFIFHRGLKSSDKNKEGSHCTLRARHCDREREKSEF